MIMESAQEAMRENHYLHSYLEQNEALVRSNLLRRLLYGRIPPAESAEAFRTLCGVRRMPHYAVMVVDVENFCRAARRCDEGLMSLAAAEGIRHLHPALITEIEDERLGVLAVLATAQGQNEAALH